MSDMAGQAARGAVERYVSSRDTIQSRLRCTFSPCPPTRHVVAFLTRRSFGEGGGVDGFREESRSFKKRLLIAQPVTFLAASAQPFTRSAFRSSLLLACR
jgi:hypothetical protein